MISKQRAPGPFSIVLQFSLSYPFPLRSLPFAEICSSGIFSINISECFSEDVYMPLRNKNTRRTLKVRRTQVVIHFSAPHHNSMISANSPPPAEPLSCSKNPSGQRQWQRTEQARIAAGPGWRLSSRIWLK